MHRLFTLTTKRSLSVAFSPASFRVIEAQHTVLPPAPARCFDNAFGVAIAEESRAEKGWQSLHGSCQITEEAKPAAYDSRPNDVEHPAGQERRGT